MSQMIGRAIGGVVLCLLVGLLLTHLGIAARGILNDTWHTILSIGRLSAIWPSGQCLIPCSAPS